MRVAFVTPEFPTVLADGGGLGTYLRRMAALLHGRGHEVEIVVAQPLRADLLTFEGSVVRHVRTRDWGPGRLTLRERLLRRIGLREAAEGRRLVEAATVAAEALEAADRAAPFDAVQSADFRGIGLRIARRRGRPLIVRCSSAARLYHDCDGRTSASDAALVRAEEETVRRADIAYAPSRLIADYYSATLGRPVRTVRPPAFLEVEPAALRAPWLPERYLIHFAGILGRRKGTVAVAEALRRALAEEPDLAMVWVGRIDPATLRDLLGPLGPRALNVLALHPLPKPALYALVRDAAAAVLPSLVDNLPNTVIESLLLGAPVIAARGGSVDELVEDGLNGALTPPGDADALAEAMVRAWRGDLAPPERPAWLDTAQGAPFRPEAAAEAFLALLS